MIPIIPNRLKVGDEVRVIAPSKSLSLIAKETKEIACTRIQEELGLTITFGKHCDETDSFTSSSIKSRIDDLHEAFIDKNVAAILTVIGGYNSNQLLGAIDYELIKSNPKILCGYSDITALTCAIFSKTSLVTFSGPHFSTFGCLKGMDYTVDYFRKCLMENSPLEVHASEAFSDDEWYLDQNNRRFIANTGFAIINPGITRGTIIGGNLCTLNLLQGTEYMPDLSGSIIFVEDDYLVFPEIFDRDLQSLVMEKSFPGVRGMVIGRFQQASNMSIETITGICRRKKELKDIPIIANVDFGHTMPLFTFPIGGKATLDATKSKASLTLEW